MNDFIKTYQYIAGQNPKTGEIIYSRATHDFITDSEGNFMDGGQLGPYFRHGGVKLIVIELPVSYGSCFDDWNNEVNQYGRISPEDVKAGNVKIVPKEEYIDRSSDDFKKYTLWGTYGKDGKGPRKTKCLCDCDTDHLEKILETQNHIGEEYRKIIKSILKDRGEEIK